MPSLPSLPRTNKLHLMKFDEKLEPLFKAECGAADYKGVSVRFALYEKDVTCARCRKKMDAWKRELIENG